jgi:hypothetical protein
MPAPPIGGATITGGGLNGTSGCGEITLGGGADSADHD